MYFISKKYVLCILLFFFGAAALSACSQEQEPESEINKSPDAEAISVTMYKNPDCQCCEKWSSYMEKNGFDVILKTTDKLSSIKKKHEVPNHLGACHTALVEGYVVEGHVPVEAIAKLLKARPEAKGIAVPGMPAGAPGTRGPDGTPYEVFLFDGQGNQSVYGTY